MTNNQNNVSSPKYQQIIETGTKLFIRHGIKRVTVEEICEESGVSKMTYYKFFKNKLELVIQIVNDMMDEGFKFTDNVMSQDIPYEEKVRQNIKYKIEGIRKYGDLFFEDFLRIPELQSYITEMRTSAVKKILEIFNIGKAEGAILGYINIMGDDDNLKKIFPDMGERVEILIDVLFHGVLKNKSGHTEV